VCGSTTGDWDSGNPAFTILHGSCGAATVIAFRCPPLLQHATFPSGFRLQVGWTTQEPPSELLLPAAGIQHGVTRRTVSKHPAPSPAARTPDLQPPGLLPAGSVCWPTGRIELAPAVRRPAPVSALGSLPHVSTLSGRVWPYLPGCPSPCGWQHSLLGGSCARPGVGPPRGAPTGPARPGRGYFVPHDRDAVGVGPLSTPGLRCPPQGRAKPPRSLPTIAVQATSGDLP
jgi:hypothetical protein